MCEIELTGKLARGRVTLIDDEDYELVLGYRWRVMENRADQAYVVTYKKLHDRGGRDKRGRGINNYPMHTLLTGFRLVDHRNGDTLDNRRSNLREATYSQNAMNRRANQGSRTGFKGVNWSGERTQRWQVRIMKEGKRHFIGNFDTPEEGAFAYDIAARELHGEFARLNFPD